jgi:hypothetical protein
MEATHPFERAMIGSLLLLLDIDGTLCPVGPGPDVEMRHPSIGAGAVSFRADLPEVLAGLAARYELAWPPPGRTTPICCWLRRWACHAAGRPFHRPRPR